METLKHLSKQQTAEKSPLSPLRMLWHS